MAKKSVDDVVEVLVESGYTEEAEAVKTLDRKRGSHEERVQELGEQVTALTNESMRLRDQCDVPEPITERDLAAIRQGVCFLDQGGVGEDGQMSQTLHNWSAWFGLGMLTVALNAAGDEFDRRLANWRRVLNLPEVHRRPGQYNPWQQLGRELEQAKRDRDVLAQLVAQHVDPDAVPDDLEGVVERCMPTPSA